MSVPSSIPPGSAPENTDALREQLNNTTAAYSRFVPREFLNLLGIEDIRKVELGQQVERKMTILFCDIRNFTALSETMSPQENFNFLNSYLVQMEPVITAHSRTTTTDASAPATGPSASASASIPGSSSSAPSAVRHAWTAR